jgi:hypothetical protein
MKKIQFGFILIMRSGYWRCYKIKKGAHNERPLLFIACYLPFGLAFDVPVAFLPVLGAAFLALAFVAILVRCI